MEEPYDEIPALLDLVRTDDIDGIRKLVSCYTKEDSKLDDGFYEELVQVYWESDLLYKKAISHLLKVGVRFYTYFPGKDSEDSR
ncbi:MAG: hypothetical protein KA998_02610 [Rickettsiaceae bacterium]|nr:hypothetical protein [Rickettsiaceae bacterium]